MDAPIRHLPRRRPDALSHRPAAAPACHAGRGDGRSGGIHPQREPAGRGLHQRQRQTPAAKRGRAWRGRHYLSRRHQSQNGRGRAETGDAGTARSERAAGGHLQRHQRRPAGRQYQGRSAQRQSRRQTARGFRDDGGVTSPVVEKVGHVLLPGPGNPHPGCGPAPQPHHLSRRDDQRHGPVRAHSDQAGWLLCPHQRAAVTARRGRHSRGRRHFP